MALIALDLARCLVIAVDLQKTLLDSIDQSDRVTNRCEYLLRAVDALNIPILLTTQNSAKLGGLSDRFLCVRGTHFDKTEFSCCRDREIRSYIWSLDPKQIILCGVETHICVSQTAQDLLREGYEVAVCPDAVGAFDIERHKLGMERMRDGGIVPIQSEAVVYDLLGSSTHPKFRELLSLTKSIR